MMSPPPRLQMARRFAAAAKFASSVVSGAFKRRKIARGNAAAFVGEMWNAAFAPRAFAATLAQKVFTNGKSDCELVAGL